MIIYTIIFLLIATPCCLFCDEQFLDDSHAIKVVTDFLNIKNDVSITTRKEAIIQFEVQAFQEGSGLIEYIDKTLNKVIIRDSNILISISDACYYCNGISSKKIWRSKKKLVVVSFFSPDKGYVEPYLCMIFDLQKTTAGQLKIFLFNSIVNGKRMLDFFKIKRNIKNGAYLPYDKETN